MNCYIAVGCIARALPCIAPRYAARRELRWYARTGNTNSTYEHLCERVKDPWSKMSSGRSVLDMYVKRKQRAFFLKAPWKYDFSVQS